jgi:hypothetical protein
MIPHRTFASHMESIGTARAAATTASVTHALVAERRAALQASSAREAAATEC